MIPHDNQLLLLGGHLLLPRLEMHLSLHELPLHVVVEKAVEGDAEDSSPCFHCFTGVNFAWSLLLGGFLHTEAFIWSLVTNLFVFLVKHHAVFVYCLHHISWKTIISAQVYQPKFYSNQWVWEKLVGIMRSSTKGWNKPSHQQPQVPWHSIRMFACLCFGHSGWHLFYPKFHNCPL